MSTGFPYFLSPDAREMDELRGKAIWAIVFGALMVVLGLLAIGHPVVSTYWSVTFIGVMLLVGGVVEGASGIWARRWGGFFLHLLVGLLYLFLGVIIIDRPGLGAAGYTLLLAAFFFATGLVRVIFAISQRFSGWGWAVLSGAVTLLLGILIWRNFPESALWVIGLFVGIELIFNGWSLVMLALAARSIPAGPPVPEAAPGRPVGV